MPRGEDQANIEGVEDVDVAERRGVEDANGAVSRVSMMSEGTPEEVVGRDQRSVVRAEDRVFTILEGNC